MKFPFTHQTEFSDCGPACLKMIAEYHGVQVDLDFLKKKCKVKPTGVSMLDIKRAANSIGLHCRGVKMNLKDLDEIVSHLPVILHWNKRHFIIVFKIAKAKSRTNYHVADPGIGLRKIDEGEIRQFWIRSGSKKSTSANNSKRTTSLPVGFALLIEPHLKKKNIERT